MENCTPCKISMAGLKTGRGTSRTPARSRPGKRRRSCQTLLTVLLPLCQKALIDIFRRLDYAFPIKQESERLEPGK